MKDAFSDDACTAINHLLQPDKIQSSIANITMSVAARPHHNKRGGKQNVLQAAALSFDEQDA